MYVVTDSIFLLQHRLVAELRVFWCELAFLRPIRVSLLGNVLQVDRWEGLLDMGLPASGHLLHGGLKLEIVDHLQGIGLIGGHALDRASRQVFVRTDANRFVVF